MSLAKRLTLGVTLSTLITTFIGIDKTCSSVLTKTFPDSVSLISFEKSSCHVFPLSYETLVFDKSLSESI